MVRLMMKHSDFKKVPCKDCGGSGMQGSKYLGSPGDTDVWGRSDCPQCKGKPEIHATVTSIKVEGRNLIIEWEEV